MFLNKKNKTHTAVLVGNHYARSRGFSMLFSVLASSLVLSIGLSIFNLTLKELVLSSSGRESQFAFYAADSGAECALYWDLEGTNIFATPTSPHTPSNPNPECGPGNQGISITPSISGGSATTQFQFDVYKPGESSLLYFCAKVKVIKTDESGTIKTTIESRGYNNQCGLLSTADINRVERALRIKY